jgi:hypothetical protein
VGGASGFLEQLMTLLSEHLELLFLIGAGADTWLLEEIIGD